MKNKNKLLFIIIAMFIVTVQAQATCNKSDVIKLIDKGFSKMEISRICGLQQQSTKKKSKWINPKHIVCRSKGGEINEGVCISDWQQANSICNVSGGQLPIIHEFKKIVSDCGGEVNKYNQNGNNSNYQACYKEKGFSSSNEYWSASQYGENTKSVWVVNFKFGGIGDKVKTEKKYVRCLRGK